MGKDFHFEGNRVVFHHTPSPLLFVYDDGGRADAGYKGQTGDCVCRAIAIATEKPYDEVYGALDVLGLQEQGEKRLVRRSHPRTGVTRVTYDRYLASLGWEWVPTMRVGRGCTTHLREGELPDGRLIVRLSRHLAAVIDGVIHDTDDPSRAGDRCVYGYFRKRPAPTETPQGAERKR